VLQNKKPLSSPEAWKQAFTSGCQFAILPCACEEMDFPGWEMNFSGSEKIPLNMSFKGTMANASSLPLNLQMVRFWWSHPMLNLPPNWDNASRFN
jgi:hypothetical protein